ETSPDFPDETRQFHASESLLCHTQISIKLPPLSSPFPGLTNREENPHPHRQLWRGTQQRRARRAGRRRARCPECAGRIARSLRRSVWPVERARAQNLSRPHQSLAPLLGDRVPLARSQKGVR